MVLLTLLTELDMHDHLNPACRKRGYHGKHLMLLARAAFPTAREGSAASLYFAGLKKKQPLQLKLGLWSKA